jgi:hypothetical protein
MDHREKNEITSFTVVFIITLCILALIKIVV